MPLGGIYKDKDIEDLYKTEIDNTRSSETRMITGEIPEEERPEKIITVRKRESWPRLEEDQIESLKRMSPEVIGNLFDRVKFLKERIVEVNAMIKSREDIHKKIIKDIDEDITEKEDMTSRIPDMEDRRNIKLDISVLRKEKRSEIRQFWRDIMELRTELQELMEQYRTESKLASIFEDKETEE